MIFNKYTLISFCTVISSIGVLSDKKIAKGPFWLQYINHAECDHSLRGNDDIKITNVTTYAQNHTTVSTSVAFLLRRQLTNDVQVTSELSQRRDNTWKKKFLIYNPGPMCTSCLSFFPTLFKRVINEAKVDDCPIPAGEYTIHDLHVDKSFRQIPVFYYGIYSIQLTFKEKGTIVGCHRFIVEVVPREITAIEPE